MTIHIVANKKLALNDREWATYQKIVQSYTTVSNNGADLFLELFDSDDKGFITALNPPHKRHTSFEVLFFLMNVYQNQRIGLMQDEVSDMCRQIKEKMQEIDQKLEKLEG